MSKHAQSVLYAYCIFLHLLIFTNIINVFTVTFTSLLKIKVNIKMSLSQSSHIYL